MNSYNQSARKILVIVASCQLIADNIDVLDSTELMRQTFKHTTKKFIKEFEKVEDKIFENEGDMAAICEELLSLSHVIENFIITGDIEIQNEFTQEAQ